MSKKIKQKDIEEVLWKDISIQKLPSGVGVFILIYEDKQTARKMLDYIHKYAFDIRLYVDKITKEYRITLEFIDFQVGVNYETAETSETYPPLLWLNTAQVRYITTGIWLEDKKTWSYTDYHDIQSAISLN